jgi:hypothetical protein
MRVASIFHSWVGRWHGGEMMYMWESVVSKVIRLRSWSRGADR